MGGRWGVCGGRMGGGGGGYAIGRAALGAVSRAVDARSPKTALSDRVLQATRSSDFDALVRWAAGAAPAAVAAAAANTAREIPAPAARDRPQLGLALLPKMELSPPVRVAVTGGLLAPGQPLRKTLLAKLSEEPSFQTTDTPVDAVAGALRMASNAGPA